MQCRYGCEHPKQGCFGRAYKDVLAASRRSICTLGEPQAINFHEGMSFNNFIQYQMNKHKKCHQPWFQGLHTLVQKRDSANASHNPKKQIEEVKYLVQIRLRASILGPLSDIHVIAAFVNPFTSDVLAEPTRMYLRRLAEVSAHSPLEASDKKEEMAFNNLLNTTWTKNRNVISLHFKAYTLWGTNNLAFNSITTIKVKSKRRNIQCRCGCEFRWHGCHRKAHMEVLAASRSSICTYPAGGVW